MAVTTIHAIKSTLSKAVLYIENPDKTDGQALVSGYNCEPQTAPIDFEMTSILAHKARNLKRKKSANLAYHLIQSFSPEDAVTPEQAHEIGKKLAFEFTGGKNEFVIATHIDKGHIHNHIILNAVSFYDYKKLRTAPYQTARQLRDISDRLCMDAQLSVITNPEKIGQLYPTYEKKKRTVSNRTEVRRRLNFCLDRAADCAQFVAMAKELGVAVTIRGKHISYLMDGAGRAIRDDSLSDTDKFTFAGISARLADNAIEQQYIKDRIQEAIQQVSTPAELTEKLKAVGVEMRLKKATGQMQYKAAALDGVWLPADALGDGYSAEGLEKALKEKDASLDASNSKTLEMRYRELTVNYPETGTSKVQVNGQLITNASKRGLVLRVCDSNGNAARLMVNRSQLETTPDGKIEMEVCSNFSYDLVYEDGTHGTIRGAELIRQMDEANHTQPVQIEISANQVKAMSLRGVTLNLPEFGVEHLFIPNEHTQCNLETGSCTISLYPNRQYNYVPTGDEKIRRIVQGTELSEMLGKSVNTSAENASLRQRIAAVERRAGIGNAKFLGKMLQGMADENLFTAADYDKKIVELTRKQMKLTDEIVSLREQKKTYATAARHLQTCKTYKAVWLEYIGKPLAEKSQFFAAHNTELQAYQQAEKQLAKIEVAPAAEPDKINNLVAAVDRRMEELQAELNKSKLQEEKMRKEQQTVTAIQAEHSEQNRNEAMRH